VFNPAELVRPNLGQRVLPQRAVDLNIVPELPASAKLTDAQLQQADGVGKCLNDYIATLAADTLHTAASTLHTRSGLVW
jgi:hypothetical protein